MNTPNFFYSAALSKASSMQGIEDDEDLIFWTRMISLNMAKQQKNLGEVTDTEYLRIRKTTNYLRKENEESDTHNADTKIAK